MVKYRALMHEAGDDVAVVVQESSTGSEIEVMTIDGGEVCSIKALDEIPLGHKISIREITEGEKIIKYGRPIGVATNAIPKGAHVHVHNIKSLRWA